MMRTIIAVSTATEKLNRIMNHLRAASTSATSSRFTESSSSGAPPGESATMSGRSPAAYSVFVPVGVIAMLKASFQQIDRCDSYSEIRQYRRIVRKVTQHRRLADVVRDHDRIPRIGVLTAKSPREQGPSSRLLADYGSVRSDHKLVAPVGVY